MIGRMTRASEMKKRLSLGAGVAVNQHRLRAALAGLPAIDAALAAGTKARVIGPRPVDLRRLAVILLEASAHCALDLLLQSKRRRQSRRLLSRRSSSAKCALASRRMTASHRKS